MYFNRDLSLPPSSSVEATGPSSPASEDSSIRTFWSAVQSFASTASQASVSSVAPLPNGTILGLDDTIASDTPSTERSSLPTRGQVMAPRSLLTDSRHENGV